LRHAREFAPDDVDVILAQAYYHQKKGDLQRAKSEYGEAIALGTSSAEAHYNLGLLYFEMKDYRSAREQARLAYSSGYPLPGLKNKLKKAGYWDDSDEKAGADSAAPPPAAER
jgi:Tfp pilus assembly protein PilF